VDEPPLPFFARLWLAFSCFFRVILDASFAGRVRLASHPLPPAPPAPAPSAPPPTPSPVIPAGPGPEQGALQVLAMFQREGRLIDFLQEETAGVSDADLGAAARQIHQGCRGALRSLVRLEPVRSEDEGQPVQVPAGYDAASLKLTGNLKGDGPYRGTLTHRGWRAPEVTLPTLLPGAPPEVLAPAEVELP